MILYFSGTGNSRYCAEILAEYLGNKIIDAGQLIKKGECFRGETDEKLIFVCPTYSWQIPELFRKFILQSSFEAACQAYFVMTCGDGIGAAEKPLKKLCDKKGWSYCGVMKVVMPENYIAMFDVPDEKRCAQLLAEAPVQMKKAVESIKNNLPFEREETRLSDGIKTFLIKPLFYKTVVGNRKFTVSEDCISCGKCEKVCVFNSIEIKNGRPEWVKRDCTHCMACISNCPTCAIEYADKSKGKRRYLCPRWSDK